MNVLEVRNLTKNYKGKKAVDSISFSLEEGKCTALLGPNGAGKTTTLNMISGLISPTSGTTRSQANPIQTDLRYLIGYLPQYPSFFDWMSGEEYLRFVGQLTNINKLALEHRIDELIEMVSLSEGRNRRIGQYSGGMKQRLGIAQALIHKPKILILDEPVSALDPFGRREVIELMRRLKNETTILFSTHILNDAEEVCDNVLFLHSGKLIENGELSQVKEKHTNKIIRLNFSSNPVFIYNSLEKEDWIEKIEMVNKEIHVNVKDQEQGRKQLLKRASDENWPLLGFEIGMLSLEEVFTKVVRG
ncbi:ATP-binding cassette domain-containing protein [Heyndrickxia sp. NPDC080065]|uniref:ABC transporter ATP-binding protein n=1 Tax=Heyndrickxia sp. NPDC080065 TaxID=3390568 RepID=UPI003D081DD5